MRLIDTELPDGCIGYTCDQTAKPGNICADDLWTTRNEAEIEADQRAQEEPWYDMDEVRVFIFVAPANRFDEIISKKSARMSFIDHVFEVAV